MRPLYATNQWCIALIIHASMLCYRSLIHVLHAIDTIVSQKLHIIKHISMVIHISNEVNTGMHLHGKIFKSVS